MQQLIQPSKGPIHAKIKLPGSQSITTRALFLAMLAEGVSEISGICLSNTTRTFITAMHQLGIVTQLDESTQTCIIAGGNGQAPKKQATVWCDNKNILAKFLLALCAATPGVYFFDGKEKLRHHSLSILLRVLSRQGAQIIPNNKTSLPFTLVGTGSLEGGEVTLDYPASSPLISALLMIAPFARNAFNFTLQNTLSPSLIELTCSMMADFGVLVHRIHQGHFMVPVPQRYKAHDYKIEPDLMLGSYFLAAAAITQGEISLHSITRSQTKQAQIRLLPLLEKMGCQLLDKPHCLTLKGTTELQGIDTSLHQFSDLFLILSVLAPFAKTPTRISHVNVLSQKERVRFAHLKSEFKKLNIVFESGDNWIKIFPSIPNGALLKTYNDFHLGMAFSVLGLKVPGITLDHTKCITNIYHDFFDLWHQLSDTMDIIV